MRNNRFYTKNSRHYIKGKFFGSQESNYCYRAIEKNAHLWGKEYFKIAANFSETEDFLDKKYIIFLRDPIRRWFSGMAEWFYLNTEHDVNYVLDKHILKLIFTTVEFDYHTDTQISFLEGLERKDFIFFDINDHNFMINLNHFTQTKMNLRPPKNLNKIHFIEENQYKMKIFEQLQRAYHTTQEYNISLRTKLFTEIQLYENSHYYKL